MRFVSFCGYGFCQRAGDHHFHGAVAEFEGQGVLMYGMVAAGLLIIYGLLD